MKRYELIYHDNENNKESLIDTYDSIEDASNAGVEYVSTELEHDDDDEDIIFESLFSRQYYVCGYGDETLTIKEILA